MSDKRTRLQKIRDGFRKYKDEDKNKLTDKKMDRPREDYEPKKKKKKSKAWGSGSGWDNIKAAFSGDDY